MPFDGKEFLGTTFDGSVPLFPKPGVWQRLKVLARAFVPGEVTPAFKIPQVPPEIATIQVLRLARTLIEDERHWIQRRYETLDGRRCAVGALRGAARLLELRGHHNEPHNLLLSVAMSRGFSDIEKMNDHSTHQQVLSAFDDAIVRAQARL
ncbi:MAG: hypothetical protein JO227_13460 [Acetobacteraceae bacterium]|nr:hypothetical protein [Acetobacteraceae bacterium]